MSILADKAQSAVSDSMGSTAAEGEFTCHTSQAVADVGQALKADAQDLRFATEDYIVEHPLKTAGIALGVGFVLGVLWTRR